MSPVKTFEETPRLILRELLPSDIDGMFELDSNAEVHRYLGDNPVTDRNELCEVIQFIRNQYETNGIGRWAVVDKNNNKFLGWAGLKWVTEEVNGHQDYYDLGFRLIRSHWGKGIATEAAIASLRYAFEQLHAKVVYAIVDCNNIASIRVLEKVGMKRIEEFILDNTMHYWYQIEYKDYTTNKEE